MSKDRVEPSGREITFGEDEIIVSKTNLKGLITYANDVFLRVSGYSASELIGKPHNIIRHPDMPRCVFKLLWDTIQSGDEVFAYVLNMARNGDAYWVFAHITPSYDPGGRMVGFHSNRRVPYTDALSSVRDLYRTLREEEYRHASPSTALAASSSLLTEILRERSLDYSQFVFSLSQHTSIDATA